MNISAIAHNGKRAGTFALLIAGISAVVLIVNILGLAMGITTVLPHLLYIPIVLAAYLFPRRGILVACIISALYCAIACFLTPPELLQPVPAMGRIVIFIAVAAVVSFLTLRLQESERLFRGVAERSSDMILLTDAAGKAQYVSPSINRMLGYNAGEITGHMPQDFIHPGDYPLLAEAVVSISRGSPEEIVTLRFRKKDGDIAVIEFIGSPVIHSDRITGIQVIGRDITERRKSEEALRRSEHRHATLLNAIPDMMFVISRDGVYRNFRAAETSALAIPPGQIIGKSIRDTGFTEEQAGGILEYIARAIDTKTLQKFEYELEVMKGKHYFEARIMALNDEEVLGIVRDITERRQMEAALYETNRKLNLLSSITRHDINNQLFSLKAFLELSKESLGKTEEVSMYIRKADMAANAIERQIAFTKEYQNLGVSAPVWQDLTSCIDHVVSVLPMRDIRIVNGIAGLEIYADSLFEKVFYNLIDNALRYGGETMTSIRFSKREAGRDLVLVVEDDGAGISPDDKQRLFERGFGHNTGLGLFLSREILAITGITIAETSGPGSGARFEITVPAGAWRVAAVTAGP